MIGKKNLIELKNIYDHFCGDNHLINPNHVDEDKEFDMVCFQLKNDFDLVIYYEHHMIPVNNCPFCGYKGKTQEKSVNLI